MLLFVVLFIGLPVLGWYIGVSIFDAFTSNKYSKKTDKNTYITHNHYDNRQVHFHTNQQEENHHLDL